MADQETESLEGVKPEVTPDDHDNGYKDVEVEFKSGRKVTIRLTAIPGRRASAMLGDVLAKKDPWGVLIESMPDAEGATKEQLLDRLSPFASSRLLGIAWALAFGTEFQKKIQALGEDWLSEMTAMVSAAPNSC